MTLYHLNRIKYSFVKKLHAVRHLSELDET